VWFENAGMNAEGEAVELVIERFGGNIANCDGRWNQSARSQLFLQPENGLVTT
jgi:hypothetical protein